MSNPTSMHRALADLIAGYEKHLVDPEVANDHERQVRESEAADERRRRRERLAEFDLELPYEAHQRIVRDENLLDRTSLVAVRRWLPRRDVPPMLVISGESGCGKTFAAAWAVANTQDSVTWTHAQDLERIFAVRFDRDSTNGLTKPQRRILLARLTVLEDIGTEKDAAEMTSTLLRILESRKQRKTLITTNMSKEAYFARFNDSRLHSRYKESLAFVYDKGGDLRTAPELRGAK